MEDNSLLIFFPNFKERWFLFYNIFMTLFFENGSV